MRDQAPVLPRDLSTRHTLRTIIDAAPRPKNRGPRGLGRDDDVSGGGAALPTASDILRSPAPFLRHDHHTPLPPSDRPHEPPNEVARHRTRHRTRMPVAGPGRWRPRSPWLHGLTPPDSTQPEDHHGLRSWMAIVPARRHRFAGLMVNPMARAWGVRVQLPAPGTSTGCGTRRRFSHGISPLGTLSARSSTQLRVRRTEGHGASVEMTAWAGGRHSELATVSFEL